MKKSFFSALPALLFSCFFFLCGLKASAQLTPGDFAIIGFNGNAVTVNLAIVALKVIPSGTILKITDQGWSQTALVTNGSDGLITWTTTSSIPAGTIFNVAITGGSTPTATGLEGYGTAVATGWAAGTVVAGGGDNWFLYTGSDAAPDFIYGFANWSTALPGNNSPDPATGWQAAGTVSAAVSYLPATLSAGDFYTTLTIAGTPPTGYHGDYNNYAGIFSGPKATLLTAIKTKSNWATTELLANKKSLDPGGAAFPGTGANPIFIVGASAPTVTNVTSTATNGSYGAGNIISIKVTFSSAVVVTGIPRLQLETGTTDRTINYGIGSGTTTLTFSYIVQPGEVTADLDYLSTTALTLNGGTIKTSGGTDAVLTLPTPGATGSLGANKDIVIDTQAPNAPSTPVFASGSDTGVSASDNITKLTSPVFTGTAEPGATITIYDTDGLTSRGDATADATTGVWSVSTTGFTAGVHTVTATAIDIANNMSARSSSLSITVDFTAPTLAITSDVSTLKAGGTAAITFTFSEDPGTSFTWDGTTGDVTVSTGTLSAISGTGLTRTATFTPTANTNSGTASIGVTLGAYTDIAGNTGGQGEAISITYDTQLPAKTDIALADGNDSGLFENDNITKTTTITLTGTAEAGATVTVYGTDGITPFGSDMGISSSSWSVNKTGMAEGTYTFTAKVTDLAGNTGPVSEGLTVTIDRTIPTLVITSDVNTLKAGGTATITFTFSEDPTTTFTWTGTNGDVVISGGTLGAISGTGLTRIATFTPTANTNSGTATLRVTGGTYTDIAGNNGGAGAQISISFDTKIPNAPSAPLLAAGSDTGIAGDNTTSVTTPTFTGTTEAGATVTLYDTDGTVLATTTADGSGKWQVAPSSALTETTHIIEAKATDVAGNIGTASIGVIITIDITAPSITAGPFMAAGSDKGIQGDKITYITTPTFTGNTEVGATVNLYDTDGTTVLATTTATGTGNWQLFPSSALAEGTHTITAKATDAAGNIGTASAGLIIVIDTTAPNAPSAPMLAAGSNTGIPGDNITSTTTPTFTGTTEANATVTLYDTNGTTVLATIKADGSGNWEVASSSALTAGTHTITAKAKDVAGNIGTVSDGATIIIDIDAPDAPSAPLLAAGSDTGIAGDHITSTTTPTFTGTAEADATIVLYDTDGTVLTMTTADGSGNWQAGPASALSAATHTITVKAVDAAGNVSAVSEEVTIVIDNTAPGKPSAPFLPRGSDTGIRGDNTTSITTPTFTGTTEAGATVTLYDTDGSTVLTTAIADGSGNWQAFPASVLSAGSHTITVKATDVAGNTSIASDGVNIIIDNTAPGKPSAPFLARGSDTGIAGDNTTSITTPTFTGTTEAGATVTLYDTDGRTVLNTTSADGSGNWQAAPASVLSAGTHTITVKTTDVAGNISTASDGVTILIDNTAPNAPLVSLPANGTTVLVSTPEIKGTAEAGAQVTINIDGTVVNTGVTTDGSGNWTYTASTLPNGNHAVKVLATDVSGNASSYSSTIAFTVNIDPTITATGTLSALTSTYGTASSSTGFTVSGVNMTAGILVTPPAGFEVSTDQTTFTNTVTAGTAGVISQVVYVRLKNTAAAGTYSGNIILSSAGAANVTEAIPNSTVSPLAIAIAADAKNKTYGNADPAFTYAITTGALVGSDAFTGVLTRSPGENVNTYAIAQGTLTLGSNYTLTYAPANLVIGTRAIAITADAKSKTYGDADMALTYQITGGSLAGADAFTGALTRNPGENVNTYAITQGTLLLNNNYALTYTPANLVIGKKALIITADNKDKLAGAVNPPLTVSYAGFITGESSTTLTVQPSITTTALTTSPIGTYDINAEGAAAANYSISYQKGTLTIHPAAPTSITLAAVALYENSASGANAGTLSSTSADPAATFTYTLVTGTGSTDNALFAINGNKINTTAILDFENKSVYKIRVRSTTQTNQSLEQELSISLTDVNEVPTLATISDQTICYTATAQTVNLSGISAGAETAQSTTLSVSSSNASLFESLTVNGSSGTGTLRYKLKNGAAGRATVTVTVTDNGGTENGGTDTYSRTFVVTVNALPVVTISSSKGTQISKGETAILSATGGISYVWAINSSILSGQNTAMLTVRPRETTTYTVTATNASGCTETQTFTLTVLDDLVTIKATNILTPNNDGYNDKWVVDNIDFYPNNEVKIFDKAGRLLYSKKGYDNSWDGTFNGTPLSEGTYYYIIDFGTGRAKFKGFITIARED